MRQSIFKAALVAIALTTATGLPGLAESPQPKPSTDQMNRSNSNEPSTRPTENRLSEMDRAFMIKAAQGGMAEVQLSQLALQKATSNSAKNYAQQMVNEHTKVNQELLQLARTKGITLPQELDAEQKAIYNRLKSLSGDRFNQAYLQVMQQNHAKTAQLFQQQVSKGNDREVKAFASRVLPAIQGHLAMVRGMVGEARRR